MTTDNMSQYQAICDSYKELPLSSLQIMRDILEQEISDRIEGFCGGIVKESVGDVEVVKAANCYKNTDEKSTLNVKSRGHLSLVRG